MSFIRKLKSKFWAPNQYVCPVCNKRVKKFNRLSDYYLKMFDKYQYIHSIFNLETFNILQYTCPKCESPDRNRLYALYFRMYFEANMNREYKFLDIAPSLTLTSFLKSFENVHYRSVDLSSKLADDNADITDLRIYRDESFDVILCSHVLEHVINDDKAIAELYRILKRGGYAIIMVPINLLLKNDYEDYSIKSKEGRWHHFAQDDHVREYSKSGFLSKLSRANFKVEQLDQDNFGMNVFDKHGIHPRSVLYKATK